MATVAADFSMSVGEVAVALGVSTQAVRKWSDAGRLTCLRTPGGQRRFRPADVDAFADSLVQEAS